MGRGWIGVDLDGTLAFYAHDDWQGPTHIGEPIPSMVERIKNWLAEGYEVRVFTARVASTSDKRKAAQKAIGDWTEKHLGVRLKATAEKDYSMIELWDDRCVQVIENTGMPLQSRIEASDRKCGVPPQ